MLSDRVIVRYMTPVVGTYYLRWWYTDGSMGVSGAYPTRMQAESAMQRWEQAPNVVEVSCHQGFDQAADPAPDPAHGQRWYLLASRPKDGLRAVRGPFRSRRAIGRRLHEIAEVGNTDAWDVHVHYSDAPPSDDHFEHRWRW